MQNVRVRLLGGPAEILPEQRIRSVAPEDLDDHIRVPFRAGYEHFLYTGTDGPDDGHGCVRHYQWSYRTCVAE